MCLVGNFCILHLDEGNPPDYNVIVWWNLSNELIWEQRVPPPPQPPDSTLFYSCAVKEVMLWGRVPILRKKNSSDG